MRVPILILAIAACVSAFPHTKDEVHLLTKKQKDVWEILKYIHNPIHHKEYAHIAETYNINENAHQYKNDAHKFFEHFHQDRFLKRGEIFSVFHPEHVKQVQVLFKLFYYAKDYETFHHTALWARHHFNEGLFLYTYCVAILHRPDTQGLVLPPIYEIYPHYFFNSEVIQQAYNLKMGHYTKQDSIHANTHQDHTEYVIHSNYSGHYLNLEPEQSLSYYLEDVGLNAFYFYFNLNYPYWLNSDEYHLEYHNRGEHFFYIFKQLFAKYHLERLSHGLGQVEFFNWDLPFKTGYYPSLVYPNGLAFQERPNLREYVHHYGQRRCDKNNYGYGYTYVQVYEQRIRDAIDSGIVVDHDGNKYHIYSQQGISILGDIIQGNAESLNYQYYGSFINMARHLLGYSKEPLDYHKLAPSALEHYSTSLRDPAFYQIAKKILLFFDQYHQHLPAYRYEHLYHQGFNVEHVDVEPLITFYDDFYSDITNGLYVTPQEYEKDSFRVKVHQYRLNHKNFNMKVHVKSEKNAVVAMKVFIGPKYDEYGHVLDLFNVQDRMFEIDHFVHNVRVGSNVIQRNSADFHFFSKDRTSYYEAYQHILQGKLLEGSIHADHPLHHGLPARSILPRGSEDGTSFQIYVIVYPYVPHNHYGDHHRSNFKKDNYPLGYPFDRPVEHQDVYHVPNSHVKVVKVYHQINKNSYREEHHDHQHVDHKNIHENKQDLHIDDHYHVDHKKSYTNEGEYQNVDKHNFDHQNYNRYENRHQNVDNHDVDHNKFYNVDHVYQNVDVHNAEHNNIHHDHVDHQNVHNDDHFLGKGDHNNYKQYHYQHQSHDDIVRHEIEQNEKNQLHHSEQKVDPETIHVQDKTAKINPNSQVSNKHFFQDVNVHKYPQFEKVYHHVGQMYVPKYQHYYHSEEEIPQAIKKYHDDNQYHDVDNSKYPIGVLSEEKYNGGKRQFQHAANDQFDFYHGVDDEHHHSFHEHHYSSEEHE